MKKLVLCLALAPVLTPALAEAPRLDLLNLNASASVEVARDTLVLNFSTTREGKDPNLVQNQLKQALDAALAEARKVAKPGQVDVQGGNLSIYPVYTSGTKANGVQAAPQISGWQGTVEMQVHGKDMAAISQLSGRIQTLNIARVNYSLSREAREKVEGDVAAQAIAAYKAKAATYAQQFGYRSYQIGEVSVNVDPGPIVMQAMSSPRFKAAGMAADEALPVESGKATVSANVSGTVLMNKVAP